MHDVLQELAKRLDFEVAYVEETAWGTMIEAVNSGRVDLVCTGLWPSATRGKLVDFSDPVYFSPVRAYVKSGNRHFDGNLSTINAKDVSIATIDGEMTSIIAAADFPAARADAHPQTTDIAQMLLEVSSGKAAVTFVETAVANGFLEKNPGTVQTVMGVSPVRVFPNVLMVAKGESKLLSVLNIALEEASNTGTIDQIIARYDKPQGTFLRRQVPYRTAP
jgi:polar amino acid transport system substrate-binding protein